MDRITKSLLDEFVTQNSLQSLNEEKTFEHFAGYISTSIHYSESFSTDDINVGAGDDCGIDCISIIANGNLITEVDEIDNLIELNDYLDVILVFVQAEKSSSFDMQKIGQFGFGVQDFTSEKPRLSQNASIKQKRSILNRIFSFSGKFKKGNPQCFLYYVTTGKWTGDQNLVSRKDSVINDLDNTNLFKKVVFECIDANAIQDLYRKTKNTIAKEIVFTSKTVYPDIAGVEQAYIGLLPIAEFLKLIENEDGEIVSSLFYDNVRHWQDWNPVNTEIKETLEGEITQFYFPLLNNGITIIAKQISTTGNRFIIEDYQIVNGCQTSYVLHETKASLNENVVVPIRLISTQDIEIRNSIIKATNRQTAVPEEQLYAMADFPKMLESYFPTFDGTKKLYYERRSRQYNDDDSIEKVRIINMNTLIKAFASMFLELPHRTSRNYKAILQTIGTEILNKDHVPEMYYVSAYAHYRLEYLFRSQYISSEFKSARYHILMAYRMLSNSDELPRRNSHEMTKYCNKIMETLWDEERYRELFRVATEVILKVENGNTSADNIRTEPFTEGVRALLKKA